MEDVLQEKIWLQRTWNEKGKWLKDLADRSRLLEKYPELLPKISQEIHIHLREIIIKMDNLDGTSLRLYLLKGGVWSFVGKALTVLLGMAMSILLARLLSPEDMGAYFLALNLATFFSIFARLGLENTLVRFISDAIGGNQLGRARTVVWKGFVLSAGGALIVAGVVFAGGGQWLAVQMFHSKALSAAIGFVSVWLVVLEFQFIFDAVFRAFQDFRSSILFSGLITASIAVVFLVFYWFAIGQAMLDQVLVGLLVAGIMNTIIAVWVLKKKMDTLPQPTSVGVTYQELIDYSWPLLLNTFTLFVMAQTDLWILATFRSEEEVAIYGAATRLVLLTGLALNVVNPVVSPLIARLYAQGQKKRLEHILRMTATLTAVPTIGVLAVFIFLGNPVLGIVFGDYYRSGATVLIALSLGQVANVLVGSCGYVLVMTGYQKIIFQIHLISIAIFFSLGIGTVNRFGPLGVAVSLAIATAFQQLSYAYFARKCVGINTLPYFNIRMVLGKIRNET